MGSSHGQQAIQGACVSETAVHDHGRRLNHSEFRPRAKSLFLPPVSSANAKENGPLPAGNQTPFAFATTWLCTRKRVSPLKLLTSHLIDGRVFFKDLTIKWCVFFLNRLTRKRGFLHETGFLSTVECSTTGSIRGPRNRGKFGDKFSSNRSQTILASGTGNPGWSRKQPELVCCETWWLRSDNYPAKSRGISPDT